MARTSVSTSSSSSSRKTCPPNKFSFMSGCMAWSSMLSLISLMALLTICVLIMSSRNIKYKNKKYKNSDIIEEGSNMRNLSINGKKPYNQIDFERVSDKFEGIDPKYNNHDNTGTSADNRIKYDINVNIRDINPERSNDNMISYAQYDANKSMERIINPLLPPERSYQNTYGVPINIPSRGPNISYQQVGILYKENIENTDKMPGNNNDSNILPLFGRPTFNGSRKWNYYTSSDKFQNFKLPITIDGRKCDSDLGCDELRDGDMISIPSYNGRFKVEIYNYDKPSYIPYVY
jgi:hypothetical protein